MPATSLRSTAQTHDSAESFLSVGSKRLFSLLRSYAARSGRAFPFQRTLAARLGVSDRQVRTYVKELRDAGFLDVRKRQHSSAEYSLRQEANFRSDFRSDFRSGGPLIGSSSDECNTSEAPRIPPSRETHRKPAEPREDPETVEQVAYWVNQYAVRMRSGVQCDPAAAVRLSRALRLSGLDLDGLQAIFHGLIHGGQKPQSLGWIIHVLEAKIGAHRAA